MPDRLIIAEPRGFCAGVEMAIKSLTWMVRIFEPPIYCYHEIVHNSWVVSAFERAGVVFVDDIDRVPPGAPLMLSAHGSAPEVTRTAEARNGVMVDAVCPLVTKVHHEVRKMAAGGYDIIYVGHEGHDEAVGTVAHAPDRITLVSNPEDLERFSPKDDQKVALIAQTTLGMHEWADVLDSAKERYPDLWTARKADLCYATTNRQSAVIELATRVQLILVVGSETSSNTEALVRVAREHGARAERIDDAGDIDPEWLIGVETVGLTAGASAPDHLVQEVVEKIDARFGFELLAVGEEDEYFPLPPQLRSLVNTLSTLVEASLTACTAGLVEGDREWSATQALGSIA